MIFLGDGVTNQMMSEINRARAEVDRLKKEIALKDRHAKQLKDMIDIQNWRIKMMSKSPPNEDAARHDPVCEKLDIFIEKLSKLGERI